MSYETTICVACLRKLTPEERHYYECRCEVCEGKWQARIEAWRKGKPDAELSEMFSGKFALSPLLGKTKP